MLDEFYRVVFRKRLYDSLEAMQAYLDGFLDEYNTQRPHQGRWCYGKTPMQTFLDSLELAKEKQIASRASTPASSAKVGAPSARV